MALQIETNDNVLTTRSISDYILSNRFIKNTDLYNSKVVKKNETKQRLGIRALAKCNIILKRILIIWLNYKKEMLAHY